MNNGRWCCSLPADYTMNQNSEYGVLSAPAAPGFREEEKHCQGNSYVDYLRNLALLQVDFEIRDNGESRFANLCQGPIDLNSIASYASLTHLLILHCHVVHHCK